MDDLISKLSEIRSNYNCFDEDEEPYYRALSEAIRILSQRADGDTIYRQDAIDALKALAVPLHLDSACEDIWERDRTLDNAIDVMRNLPSAQPEQRYTEEELRVFAHGISLSLLSKRSAQHWRYDKDTATEIEFLERLYDKVGADMKGGQG